MTNALVIFRCALSRWPTAASIILFWMGIPLCYSPISSLARTPTLALYISKRRAVRTQRQPRNIFFLLPCSNGCLSNDVSECFFFVYIEQNGDSCLCVTDFFDFSLPRKRKYVCESLSHITNRYFALQFFACLDCYCWCQRAFRESLRLPHCRV